MQKTIKSVKTEQTTEQIEHPTHYNVGSIEVWDAIADWNLGFLEGNIIKYIARAGHKNDRLTDIKKAKAYIDKLISIEERKLSL